MTTQLVALGAEFLALRDSARRLSEVPEATLQADAETHRQSMMDTIYDHMFNLTQTIVSTHASSCEELAHKARVALDWIEQDGDITDLLACSVCRDVIVLFPPKHNG